MCVSQVQLKGGNMLDAPPQLYLVLLYDTLTFKKSFMRSYMYTSKLPRRIQIKNNTACKNPKISPYSHETR
jgi:hypothetical protein